MIVAMGGDVTHEAGEFDLLVIGGGINGAGIARDAAGRGLKILLVEQDDLAGHTSSASTKLIHGGLRYLEHYEFRLVRESLIERERLLRIAPHIIWPLRFILPYDKGLRPKWMLRLGLFLYDHLGGRKLLPPSRSVDLRQPPYSEVLDPRLTSGFEYSDCWVDDARLVALNCVDARNRGADIRTRTRCTALERGKQHWTATLHDRAGEKRVRAKAIVNAAGPWVDKVLTMAIPGATHANLRLVKGSHLIFPRLHEGANAYIFQNGDGRIVFAIPYEGEFTLVGTTDVRFEGDASSLSISDQESRYLCTAINQYLRCDVAPEQAVASYAGVRPLYDDKSASDSTVTRDYVFELNQRDQDDTPCAPILSIFGGKITTYRKLAEHALKKMRVGGDPWTAGVALPGGDFSPMGFDDLLGELQAQYPWLPPAMGRRLARAYGTRSGMILGNARSIDDLGEHMGGDLYARELEYLVAEEFAESAQDVLWRRSKLKLHLSDAEQARVERWFEKRSRSE